MKEILINPEIDKYKTELTTAIEAVQTAGRVILDQENNRKAKRYSLEFKSEVDNLADVAGIEVIKKYFPGDNVLTEEQEIPKNISGRLWVADLLDGTTNFLNGSRNYSVLLSFVENGKLKVGVSYLPVTDELFYAIDGQGAYLNGKKIHVSTTDFDKSTVIIDPGYDPKGIEKTAKLMMELRPKIGNIAMYNANGYTLSMLAKGELSGLVHFYSKIWESAGFLLVKEAGGKITDKNGKELELNFGSSEGFQFVASNGLIHEELLKTKGL